MTTRRAVWMSETMNYIDAEPGRPTPAPLLDGHIGAFVEQVLRIVGGLGVLLLDPTAAARLGLPAGAPMVYGDEAKNHPVAAKLRQSGFMLKEVGRWFHVKHGKLGELNIGLTEYIDPDYCPMVNTTQPTYMTAALARWHLLAGQPWYGSAGDAGDAILRAHGRFKHDGRLIEPTWWAWDGPEMDPTQAGVRPSEPRHETWAWNRDLGPDHGYTNRHGYDRCRAYLAAMTCTPVAGFKLKHDPRPTWDRTRAGMWLVETAPWDLEHLMPDPAGWNPDGSHTRWLATPRVQLLTELAAEGLYDFQILESWTAPGTDLLKKYAAKIRSMWDLTAEIRDPEERRILRESIKATYRMQQGGWSSRRSDLVQRYDWSNQVTSMNASNVWRACWKAGGGHGNTPTWAGPWPLTIDVDNVWYPGGDDRPTIPGWQVWPAGMADDQGKLGHWRESDTQALKVSRETVPA